MRIALDEVLAQQKILLLDGSMSTPLEAMGCDLNDPLWTARALAERPELVRKVHLDYFRAGADAGITDSYQATIPGLTERGYSLREAEDLIARSVELFLEARRTWWEEEGRGSGRPMPLCLGSVGPYGAYLADGSEYRGNYGVSDQVLRDFHRRRMEILWEAGADLLALETMPSLHEARIAADLAEELGADYYVSFSCRDGSHICAAAAACRWWCIPTAGKPTTRPPRPGTGCPVALISGTMPVAGCGQAPRRWAAAAERWTVTSARRHGPERSI